MLFIEGRYLLFFALVFLGFWRLRGERPRKVLLLAASYAFYAAWDYRFLSLIAGSTLVDYWVGLRLGAVEEPRARRRWIALSLAANLGLLGVFKYFHFFVDSAVELLDAVGLPASRPSLQIVLPVGISFYTFQTLSYSLDVFRRRLAPVRSLLDLALFVGFFPQLVAGPIVRASDFLPQLGRPRRWAQVDARAAVLLFAVGFFKKACLADNLAVGVDDYFARPEAFDSLSAYLGTFLFAAQIYCDFSGYSDMAIASAALLGFHFHPNFDAPYLAANVRDFWRRWHISLSTWLRDYLYIPLGGNRGGRVRTAANLLLTMVLGGLWHGAAWTFVAWGLLHGLALGVHRWWERARMVPAVLRRGVGRLGLLLTFGWVCLAWVFFRSADFPEAWTVCRALVGAGSGTHTLGGRPWMLLAALAVLHLGARRARGAEFWRRGPDWAFAVVLALVAALAMPLVPTSAAPFLYFQF